MVSETNTTLTLHTVRPGCRMSSIVRIGKSFANNVFALHAILGRWHLAHQKNTEAEWQGMLLATGLAALCSSATRVFGPSVPAIDAQQEAARFSIPISTLASSDGLIIDAVKNIVHTQRRAPVSIDLITGTKVDHKEGALHTPG